MRATCLSSLMVLALLCLWQPSLAQDKPPEGASGPGSARIGTLSPDEARRAERARKRRAGAATPKPAEASAPPPAPAPAREAKSPPPLRETKSPPPAREAKRPPPTPPPATEPHHVADAPQRPAETAAPREPASVHANVPPPHRARVAHDRPAHASRRRATARNEDREDQPRYRPPRNRRTVMEAPGWRPRIGDTVPPGVPLYPLPPAYRAGPPRGYEVEEPGWAYRAPPPPAFAPAYGYADE